MQDKKENVSLKGVYIFTKAKLVTPFHYYLQEQITSLLNAEKREKATRLIRLLNSICETERFVVENIIPTVGRTLIANNLCSATPVNLMRIKYAEVGTGTNAPANGNTTLQTSLYRNSIASITNVNNVGYATAFFTANEVTGTFKEAGIFCDGSSTQGSGVLLSRVAIDVTKSNSETLTIDWTLTIN